LNMPAEEQFKAPEQKKAEEKPVEAQQELEGKKERAAPREAKKDEKKDDKAKRVIVLERVVTIPLSTAYKKPRNSRANYAVRLLRSEVARAFKVKDLKKVKIMAKASHAVAARGGRYPPKRLKVACAKDKDGVVTVELA